MIPLVFVIISVLNVNLFFLLGCDLSVQNPLISVQVPLLSPPASSSIAPTAISDIPSPFKSPMFATDDPKESAVFKTAVR